MVDDGSDRLETYRRQCQFQHLTPCPNDMIDTENYQKETGSNIQQKYHGYQYGQQQWEK